MRDRLGPLLAAYAGLDPPAWAIEARVRDRSAALGIDEADYVERLDGNPAELGRLVELLRVGETRFFRHRAQLDVLTARVLPTLRAPVNAWSAGCATGEEAWTLAILLAERGLSFSLTASDLSATALAKARRGGYPAARVEAEVPAPLVERYFRRVGDERVLNDRLRPHVRFVEHNLLSPLQPEELDLVFCRNVLIYFDERKRAQVVQKLLRALAPGGWLLVGYSETLRDCAELTSEAHAIYRKSDPSAPSGERSARAARTMPGPAHKRSALATAAPLPGSRPQPATGLRLPGSPPTAVTAMRTLALRGDYFDGQRLAAELRPLVATRAPALVDLDGASFLGDEAARVLKRAAEAAPRLQLKATRVGVQRWLARHGIRLK
jgi:chemotaxis protein methyltransferase CheR